MSDITTEVIKKKQTSWVLAHYTVAQELAKQKTKSRYKKNPFFSLIALHRPQKGIGLRSGFQIFGSGFDIVDMSCITTIWTSFFPKQGSLSISRLLNFMWAEYKIVSVLYSQIYMIFLFV